MKDFTVYDVASGRPLRILCMGSDMTAANVHDGESMIVGRYDEAEGYIADGDFITFPLPRPSPHHIWDRTTEAWIDPRTPADMADALEARRAVASLSKVAFIVACRRTRIITDAEAEEAAEGKIPASFVPIIDAMPPEVRIEARIAWKASTVMERLDPLILSIADAIGLTAAQLDALFGVE